MGIGIFLGILLVLAGIAIILRTVFNLDIPVFKILLALVFLYIGIRLLTGGFSGEAFKAGEKAIVFGQAHFKGLPSDQEYSVVFGQAVIDLSGEPSPEEIQELRINTIFGSTELILRTNQPFRIKVDAAFAGAMVPDRETAFGELTYQSEAFEASRPYIDVEAHVVFGEFKVRPLQ